MSKAANGSRGAPSNGVQKRSQHAVPVSILKDQSSHVEPNIGKTYVPIALVQVQALFVQRRLDELIDDVRDQVVLLVSDPEFAIGWLQQFGGKKVSSFFCPTAVRLSVEYLTSGCPSLRIGASKSAAAAASSDVEASAKKGCCGSKSAAPVLPDSSQKILVMALSSAFGGRRERMRRIRRYW